jgi:5-methylcytosine-specific restriction protein A
MDNPLCVDCKTADLLTAANVVDHIVPHRGDMNLFWSEDNWQPLCKRCHDLKTAQGL